MITEAMRRVITTYNAGAVATVNSDGTPSVSPKATFVVIDATTIAFGNIRSPGTLVNLAKRPAVEVCFTDILARKALRVSGAARIVSKAAAPVEVAEAFQAQWPGYIGRMAQFVVIDVAAVEEILSPAYDDGASEADLRADNLAKLNAI